MKAKAAEGRKRTYLARDDRRQALLDIAARVVEERGWPALSMISVAETGGVSRQLVYQHFASVDELVADTLTHLFRGRYEGIRGTIEGNPDNLAQLIRLVETQTFDEPPARVRALWQMLTATYSDNAETARTGTRLRHLLIKLWTPTVSRQFGLDERESQALVWMLHMAFWGAHQLVEEGELSRKTATELFTWMVMRLGFSDVPAPAAAPRPAARRTRKAAQ